MPRTAFLFLPFLAFAGPAHAAGWSCSVSEALGPNVTAAMDMRLGADRGRTTLEFYLRRAEAPGHVATQIMSWVAIPHDATRLWKPDRIEVAIPARGSDRNGMLLFQGPGERETRPAREISDSLRPHFDMLWVKLEEPAFVARLWGWSVPWRIDHLDRRMRRIASAEFRLPGAAEAQSIFTRLRAAIDRKAADPAANCRAIADREPQEEDII
jgi:hypothetical protein